MQAHHDTSLLHGAFSSSLRDRHIWSVLEPVFMASLAQFHELDLLDHDFIFLLGSAPQNLRVLFLSPASLEQSTKEETITRLQRFSPYAASNPQTNVVAFLISELPFTRANRRCNLNGFLGLQALIAESLQVPIPIIPIPNCAGLLSSIQRYMSNLVILPMLRPELSDAVALLSTTTRSSCFKLNDGDMTVLTELCPSLTTMSKCARKEDVREILKDLFGEALGTEIARFWEEDEHD